MRPIDAIAVLAMTAPILAAGPAAADPLDDLKGTRRPVVVLSDSRDDPRVAEQISALDHTRPELDERNIQVLTEAQPDSAMRAKLGVGKKGFAVVLVGKDGSVKKVWHDPVDPKQIFSVIDSMPMRKDEMKG